MVLQKLRHILGLYDRCGTRNKRKGIKEGAKFIIIFHTLLLFISLLNTCNNNCTYSILTILLIRKIQAQNLE